MLTILAAFAQAESESGSVGAKMVYQRKYEAGIPVQYLERSFGFKKDERGVYIADKEEAAWVRKIYEMAADGYTPASIKRYLNENGVKTVGGAEWIDSTVFRLIENEIYKGDYIMHKHFVNEERKLVRDREKWMRGTSKMTMKPLFPPNSGRKHRTHWKQSGIILRKAR